MRGLLVVLLGVLFAMLLGAGIGCTITSGSSADDDVVDPFPFPGSHDGCRSDTACGRGNVCTRNGACLPSSQVRAVHVTWLVKGQPADATTCSAQPDLSITIKPHDGGDQVSYAPVPCEVGKFTVDKLPTTFDRVQLGPRRTTDGWSMGSIDANGDAALDLSF
jgi:hypothetical protein